MMNEKMRRVIEWKFKFIQIKVKIRKKLSDNKIST